MELTFVTDFGDSFVVEIDPNMELENVMALLEAEVSYCYSPFSCFRVVFIHITFDSLQYLSMNRAYLIKGES